MFDRLTRGWTLIKASAAVLRQDKELLIFPVCSMLASLLVLASFIVPLVAMDTFDTLEAGSTPQALEIVLMFSLYLALYFVSFFFNAALVGAAMIRLQGGDPTVGDGLRIASSKLLPILGFAGIAATIGLILRLIEERAGFIGRWIAGLLGVAFSLATFLTVPLIVTRDIGPVEAVKESAVLLKRTWGENIIGNGSMGLAFAALYALVAALFACLFVWSGGSLAVLGAAALAIIALALLHTALQGVYSAALYLYASGGADARGFDSDLLQGAFRPKA
jgi:hypothetical protein